jgi:hypothetical protein
MDVLEFFDKVRANGWRNNIEAEVSYSFDKLLEDLSASKTEVIKKTSEQLEILDEFKKEEKEEMTYSIFQKWVERLMTNIIIERLDNRKDESENI